MGTLPRVATTVCSMSSIDAIRPTPLISVSCAPAPKTPPEKFRLLRSMASRTSSTVRSWCLSISGFSRTWYCFTNPPRLMMNATPGTPCSW